MTRKLVIHDGRGERELVLVGTITVGRDPACHISDLDPLLSRRHAEFVTTSTGCTVRDLGSRNGMLINGTKIREHRLMPGDLVQLGHLQMRYAEDHAVMTPEVVARAHATTAHDSARITVPPVALDDTRPHPPHDHAGYHDDDVTRASGSTSDDTDVTRAGASDDNATRAPLPKKIDDDATVAPRGAPTPPADNDDTMAPVGKRTSAPDLDATVASNAVSSLDVTVAGRPAQPTVSPLDATFVAATPNNDATFVPGMTRVQPASRVPATEARLSVGVDLKITTASPGCRDLLGAAPEALVGRPLGDVLAERIKTVSANGPMALTLVVERMSADRSLSVILKTAPPVEIVS